MAWVLGLGVVTTMEGASIKTDLPVYVYLRICVFMYLCICEFVYLCICNRRRWLHGSRWVLGVLTVMEGCSLRTAGAGHSYRLLHLIPV